jgi:hypothetical protein
MALAKPRQDGALDIGHSDDRFREDGLSGRVRGVGSDLGWGRRLSDGAMFVYHGVSFRYSRNADLGGDELW